MASQHAKKGVSITHILADGDQIKGYYTLTCGEINTPIKGYPRTIPVIIIGRIGISKPHQGKGLSQELIRNAIKQAKAISQMAGVAFAVIDAKTNELAHYYQKLGFLPLVGNRLVYPISQI